MRADLAVVLKKLKKTHESGKPIEAIVIETTGMADPAPVAHTFFVDDEIASFCQLDGIVTLVDAKHIVQHLDEEKPEGAENESVEQVAFADRLILNKCDLVPKEEDLKAVETCVEIKLSRHVYAIDATPALTAWSTRLTG